MIAAMGRWVTREMRRRPSLGARSSCRTEDDVVRQAVAPKGGAWTVFLDAEPMVDQRWRMTAAKLATGCAFEVRAGQTVELLLQSCCGEMSRRSAGGSET